MLNTALIVQIREQFVKSSKGVGFTAAICHKCIDPFRSTTPPWRKNEEGFETSPRHVRRRLILLILSAATYPATTVPRTFAPSCFEISKHVRFSSGIPNSNQSLRRQTTIAIFIYLSTRRHPTLPPPFPVPLSYIVLQFTTTLVFPQAL